MKSLERRKILELGHQHVKEQPSLRERKYYFSSSTMNQLRTYEAYRTVFKYYSVKKNVSNVRSYRT